MTAEELIHGRRVFSKEDVLSFYRGKSCIVTGALGTIGRAIYEELSKVTVVRGIDFDELRVSENPWCELGDFADMHIDKADYVFHAAAYKHVILGEKNRAAITRNNFVKTQQLISHCYGKTKIVFISTDKAAGESIMGVTKRLCEAEMERAGHVSIRLVNVARSRGSVLDRWERDEVKVCAPRNVKRYFFQIDDCVQAILKAGQKDAGTYTVNNVPMFSLGDLAAYYERSCVVFADVPLQDGELLEESLINSKFERLVPTSCNYIYRIERA